MNTEFMMVSNRLRTPDGTILESRHRHDYKEYLDANGKTYMLDGGLSYVRSSLNGDEEHLTVTTSSPHELIREYTLWGTYGKDGNQPLEYKQLKDMDTAHIQAVLDNVPSINPAIAAAMRAELVYRESIRFVKIQPRQRVEWLRNLFP